MNPSSPTQIAEKLYQQARSATSEGDARAIDFCEQALEHSPHPGAMALLGSWRVKQQRWTEAIELIDAARNGGYSTPESLNQLATAHYRSGNLRLAVNALTTALKLDPDHVDSHLNVASMLLEVRQLDLARVHAERAIELSAERYESLLGMGLVSRAAERSSEALDWFARAEATAPSRIEAPMAAGAAYQEMGMPIAAIAAFERALRWNPAHADLLSNRLFTTNFLPEWDAAESLALHRSYERSIRIPQQAALAASLRTDAGDDRCRIGYVSGDFRNHAVARFLLPVLKSHDHSRFHITGYYTGRTVDATTREIAEACDAFRQAAPLTDTQLLQQIAADAIDILIDLSGHSSGNRLPVFAARAAPVQIAWLGYLGSTGLSAMDYRLTDAIADPIGVSDAWHSEHLIRLPQTMWAYQPYAEAPEVSLPPFQRNGFVTFGALSNPAKLSDLALAAWAAVMQASPDSRLVIMGRDDDAVRERILRPFLDAGVDAGRITLLSRMSTRAYLEAYADIDIALDPFPYCGGTTVCDALWQGVPVLAVRSLRPFGGSAATILHQVGLDDWVADGSESLVALAVRVASKADARGAGELETLRRTQRERMRTSPLSDAEPLTRQIEDIYSRLIA